MTQEATQAALAPEMQDLVQDVVQLLQRDLNRLMEPTSDRTTKRRALESIAKETVGRGSSGKDFLSQHPLAAPELLHSVYKPLLQMLDDSIEKCRELAVSILMGFFSVIEDAMPFLPYLIPIVVDRLAFQSVDASSTSTGPYGQQEFKEPSEELRLQSIQLLLLIVERNGNRMGPCVDDLALIISKSLGDSYAEVKKVSCKLLILLAETAPQQVAMQQQVLYKALLSNFGHKHANVRAMSIQAFGTLMLADAAALEESTNLDHIRKLVLDRSPAVREALFQVIAQWMQKLKYNYGFAPKLLPIFLAGFHDTTESIRRFCREAMNELGVMYERDYQETIKDEMDFSPDIDLQDRPRIGCRHLFRDNTLKCVNALLAEAGSWTAESRTVGLQSLYELYRFAEMNMTGYSSQILTALVKCSGDEDAGVRRAAIQVAQMMSRYVQMDVCLDVLSPMLGSTSLTSQSKSNALTVLNALLEGLLPHSSFWKEHTDRILGELTSKLLIECEDGNMLKSQLNCLKNFLRLLVDGLVPTLDQEKSFQLTYALLCLENPIHADPAMTKEASALLTSFATKHHGFNNVDELYDMHMRTKFVPGWLEKSSRWNNHCFSLRLFQVLMRKCPFYLQEANPLSEQIFVELLVPLANAERETQDKPEPNYDIRPVCIHILSTFLAHYASSLPAFSLDRSKLIVERILVTNLIWRGGRKAERNRKETMLLAHQLVKILDPQAIADSFEAENGRCLFSTVLSCTDEDVSETREHALLVLQYWFQDQRLKHAWTGEMVKTMYPELMKRLDDAQDSIRVQAVDTLKYMLQKQGPCPNDLDSVHYDALLKGISIHLDDSEVQLQTAVAELLISSASSNEGALPSDLMRTYLQSIQHRFRNQLLIDSVLKSI